MTPLTASFAGLDARQSILIALPPVLIASMFYVFRGAVAQWGMPLGYLIGFVVYWVVWCLIVPVILLGGVREVLALFGPGTPTLGRLGWGLQAALWWPVIFPLAFRFIPRLGEANAAILIASVLLGVVIGVTEELLWRGVYVRAFPQSLWLSVVYPAVGFALWHIAPLAAHGNPSPGGTASFVGFALVLGLTWGLVAAHTGSIRWTTFAHVVHDALGLGAFVYAAWLVR